MSEHDLMLLAAAGGGFCAGALNAWCWLLPMSPQRRDAFLEGVRDGINPAFWWRRVMKSKS